MSGSWLQGEHYFTVVPHGWRRELDEQGAIYYLSPDLHKLCSSEELLHYLTTNDTCKCGLRCPFHLEQQFSFSPSIVSLEDCHPSQHDSTPTVSDPQSLCKATHYHHSASNTSPQKYQQRNFTPSIRLTRSNVASKYRRDSQQMYNLTPTGNSGSSLVAGQKRPALVANLNLGNTSAGKSKRIKVDSSSTILTYNSSTGSGGRSSKRPQSQTLRVNGHSQRVQDHTTISIKSNTNNNSSSSYIQPSTTSTTIVTTGTNNNRVLHLVPSSNAQHTFVLDEESQQKLLSLLAGSAGGVATCSVTDANIMMAVSDKLKVQPSNAGVLETILCRNESSKQEEQICDQVASNGEGFDSNRDVAHVRDVGGGFQNTELFNANPLLFLANAAEEIECMLKTDVISTNEKGRMGQLGSVETLDTNEEGREGNVGQFRVVECSSDNKERLSRDSMKKESGVCSAATTLEESPPPISANNESLYVYSESEVPTPSETDTTSGQLYSPPPQGDNLVINAILSRPRSNENLTNTGTDNVAAAVGTENSTSLIDLVCEPQYTVASISPDIDDESLLRSTSGPIAVSDFPPPNPSSVLPVNDHSLQQESNEEDVSTSKEPPSLSNADEQKDKVVQNESPAQLQENDLQINLTNSDTIDKEGISSLEQNERMDSADALTEAKLVDERLLNLLQKAVDFEDASQLFTPSEENLVEYCMKMVDQQQPNCSHEEDAQSANSAVVDKFQPMEVSKNDPSTDGTSIVNSCVCEENALSADLVVDTEVKVNKNSEPELPSTPFNSHVSTSEENARSADSAKVPVSEGQSVKTEDIFSSLLNDEIDDAGPCPIDLTSLATDDAQCSQPGAQLPPPPISDSVLKNQSLGVLINEEEREKFSHTSAKGGTPAQVLDSLSKEEECDTLAGASNEELGSGSEEQSNSVEDRQSPSKENYSNLCMQPGAQQSSTISSNLLSDQNSEEESCVPTTDTAPLLIIPPQIQISNSLSNEDCSNTCTEARSSLDDEYLSVDGKPQSAPVDQQSSPKKRNTVYVQVKVNFSPPISNNDMSVKICEEERNEKSTTVHAPVSPSLPPPLLLTTLTSQSQASHSLTGASVNIDQEICTDLEQFSDSVREQPHCDDDTPCLQQGDDNLFPISDSVSKDQNLTEDISPSPISTATSQSVAMDTELKAQVIPIEECSGSGKIDVQDGGNQLKECVPDMSESALLMNTDTELKTPVEERSNSKEMDIQSGKECVSDTCMSHTPQYIESSMSMGLKTQLVIPVHDREEMDVQGGVNQLKEFASDMPHEPQQSIESSALPMDSDLDEGGKHNDIQEVNIQSGVNHVTKSTDSRSIESDIRVPPHPELGQQSVPVAVCALSDDAVEMDDHNDSVEATKSTDIICTNSAQSAESAECEQQLVPFKEHPPQDYDNVDGQSDEDQTTESTSTHTTQSIERHGVPATTYIDLSPTNTCIELNGNHEHIDIDLPHSDFTAEVYDQDDLSSSTLGIITTSACFRKEWSVSNSDSQSTSTGLLSRSGSYNLSDSFNSCDQYSLADSIGSSGPESTSERVPEEAPREIVSDEKIIEHPTSLTSSSFKRKKTSESGLYAASKVIMTRSKFADLRKIGDDLTISQALASPFHDISGSDQSFGLRSPEDECLSKNCDHPYSRSLSVSSMESASSVCSSLQGEANTANTGSSNSSSSLSSPLPPDCPYQIGDIVWAKAPQLMAWPGVIISHTERKKDRLIKPPPGKVWVQWIGHSTVSLVELSAIKALREGIKHRTKHGKKMPKRLQESVNQALKLLKKQQRNKSVVKC